MSGAGKAFCSGQDLKDIKNHTSKRSLSESVLRRYNPMILAMREMPKPIIAKLNGVAAGQEPHWPWHAILLWPAKRPH